MRVIGLVRLFQSVRAAMRDGLSPARAARLRVLVARFLQDLDAALAAQGLGPETLPPASRNAYRFLAAADLTRIPRGTVRPAELALSGATAETQRWAARIWRDLDRLEEAPACQALAREMASRATAIEADCRGRGTDPSALKGAGRLLYAWLRWLADGRLADHVDALFRARDAGASRAAGLLEIHLVPLGSLWRAMPTRDGIRVRVAEGFVGADKATWRALLIAATGRRALASVQTVRRFAEGDEFRAVGSALDALTGPPGSPRGRVHDLEAAFERVNALCFGGRLARPGLEWSRLPTTRQLGAWRPGLGRVSLSVTLDDEAVPEGVVDYILYHELLHIVHGTAWGEGGRRQVHTRAFRGDEARFPGAAEAEAWIKKMS